MNGPSDIDSLPRRRRTRTPSEVGRRPAVLISRPALVNSSISLPMSLMSCSLGTWPVFSLMRIIDMNRMVIVSLVVAQWRVVLDDCIPRHLATNLVERRSGGSTKRVIRVPGICFRSTRLGAKLLLIQIVFFQEFGPELLWRRVN